MGLLERVDAFLDWMREWRWQQRAIAVIAGILVGGLTLWVSGFGQLAWREHPKPVAKQSLPPVVPAPRVVNNVHG
jgi:hypothetical protein